MAPAGSNEAGILPMNCSGATGPEGDMGAQACVCARPLPRADPASGWEIGVIPQDEGGGSRHGAHARGDGRITARSPRL